MKLKVNSFDVDKISGLIYESNQEILKYIFGKNKEKAQKKIKKLIQIGKNHYGYENIYVAYDDNIMVGFFIGYTGKEQNDRQKNTDGLTFLKLMKVYGLIKYKLFIRPLFMKVTLVDVEKDDFYIDYILTDKNYEKNEVNYFLLEKAIEVAKSKNCRRLVTNVSLKNSSVKKFFEAFGFKTYDKKTHKVNSEIIGNYFMELLL